MKIQDSAIALRIYRALYTIIYLMILLSNIKAQFYPDWAFFLPVFFVFFC